MAHHHLTPEISFAPEHSGSTRRIWRVLILLSVITLVELGLGLWMYFLHKSPDPIHWLILAIKGAILILSLVKAYYIVGVFMHLGDENRNFRMTIIVPLTLFIWFIIAFLWDGASWRDLRNTDAGSRTYVEQKHTPVPAIKANEKP